MVQGKELSLEREVAFRDPVCEWDALLSPSLLQVLGGHENLPRGWTILICEGKLCLNLARTCLCIGGSWASISQFLRNVCLGGNYCFLWCVKWLLQLPVESTVCRHSELCCGLLSWALGWRPLLWCCLCSCLSLPSHARPVQPLGCFQPTPSSPSTVQALGNILVRFVITAFKGNGEDSEEVRPARLQCPPAVLVGFDSGEWLQTLTSI